MWEYWLWKFSVAEIILEIQYDSWLLSSPQDSWPKPDPELEIEAKQRRSLVQNVEEAVAVRPGPSGATIIKGLATLPPSGRRVSLNSMLGIEICTFF